MDPSKKYTGNWKLRCALHTQITQSSRTDSLVYTYNLLVLKQV